MEINQIKIPGSSVWPGGQHLRPQPAWGPLSSDASPPTQAAQSLDFAYSSVEVFLISANKLLCAFSGY